MDNNEYLTIKKEIRRYAKDMNQWWKSLQQDSVAEWMLLTSFGCWGVPNRYFQIASFILTILFFSGKLSKPKNKYSFSKSEFYILKQISEANISVQESNKLVCRLKKIKEFRQKNILFIIKRNWRFVSGYTFLTLSFLYNILQFRL